MLPVSQPPMYRRGAGTAIGIGVAHDPAGLVEHEDRREAGRERVVSHRRSVGSRARFEVAALTSPSDALLAEASDLASTRGIGPRQLALELAPARQSLRG